MTLADYAVTTTDTWATPGQTTNRINRNIQESPLEVNKDVIEYAFEKDVVVDKNSEQAEKEPISTIV